MTMENIIAARKAMGQAMLKMSSVEGVDCLIR